MRAKDVAQRLAFDVLHDDEVRAVLLTPVVDADDVGMVEGRRAVRLATEAFDEARVAGELGEQDLHRDEPVEDLVAGEVDVGHPAPGDGPFDRVTVREGVFDRRHRRIRVVVVVGASV